MLFKAGVKKTCIKYLVIMYNVLNALFAANRLINYQAAFRPSDSCGNTRKSDTLYRIYRCR